MQFGINSHTQGTHIMKTFSIEFEARRAGVTPYHRIVSIVDAPTVDAAADKARAKLAAEGYQCGDVVKSADLDGAAYRADWARRRIPVTHAEIVFATGAL
jgi:hypothetical protein